MYVKCMCECLKRNVFSNESFHVGSLLLKNIFVVHRKIGFSRLSGECVLSSQRRFTKRSTSTGFVLDYSIFLYSLLLFQVSKCGWTFGEYSRILGIFEQFEPPASDWIVPTQRLLIIKVFLWRVSAKVIFSYLSWIFSREKQAPRGKVSATARVCCWTSHMIFNVLDFFLCYYKNSEREI